jgi:hypothetical protein
MIAALLGSSKAGGTGCKVAVRYTKAVHVTGMKEGDILQILFHGKAFEKSFSYPVNDNTVMIIPELSEWVEVLHIEASGVGQVFVDLR